MNEISLICTECNTRIDGSIRDAGKDIKCTSCGHVMQAPKLPKNPFIRPVMSIVEQIKTVEWDFPFVAQGIQCIVLAFVLVLLVVLAATIGIAIQVGGVFHVLLLDATSKFKVGGYAERSAYAICAGIYLMLFIPFWIVQLPFSILGWLWTCSRALALALGIIILAFGIVSYLQPTLIPQLFDQLMEQLGLSTHEPFNVPEM